MQLRMNNVQSVVNNIMITKFFDPWKFFQQGISSLMITKFFTAWKFCQQGISRSNRFSQFDILPEVMLRSSMRLMDRIFHMWKHKVQSDLQLKQQSTVLSTRTPESKFASISRRRLLTETNQVGERLGPSIQGLQEGNLDLTRSFISPSTNARVKKSLSARVKKSLSQAHGAARNRLQLVYETHDLGQITYETHHLGYLQEIGRRVPILVCGEIAKCCDPVTGQALQNMCFIVMTVMVI
jgi:hypothetical protein